MFPVTSSHWNTQRMCVDFCQSAVLSRQECIHARTLTSLHIAVKEPCQAREATSASFDTTPSPLSGLKVRFRAGAFYVYVCLRNAGGGIAHKTVISSTTEQRLLLKKKKKKSQRICALCSHPRVLQVLTPHTRTHTCTHAKVNLFI